MRRIPRSLSMPGKHRRPFRGVDRANAGRRTQGRRVSDVERQLSVNSNTVQLELQVCSLGVWLVLVG
jgi:hypothetical protein